MTGIYAKLENKPDAHTVTQQIERMLRKDVHGLATITISADNLNEDPAAAAALLQKKLLDSKIGQLEIQVADDDERANKFAHDLVIAAFTVNLQTLKSIKLTGMKDVSWDDLLSPLQNNFFVNDIALPVDPLQRERLHAVQARNQIIANYHNIGKKHYGFSGWGFVLGLSSSFVSLTCLAELVSLVGPTLLTLMGITAGSGLAFAIAPPLFVLAVAIVLPLSFVLPQLIINIRSQFIRRRYEKLAFISNQWTDDVKLSLTDTQIEHCNGLIDALNQARPTFAIAKLSRSESGELLPLRSHHARLVTTLAQLTELKPPFTHFTTSTFNLLLAIAHSCGYESNATSALPMIKDEIANPKLIDKINSIANFYDLRTFMGSLNPKRGQYNTVHIEHVKDYEQHDLNDISYSSADTAIDHIANDLVLKATVFVNSKSLEWLAVACNDNSTMQELTLRFSKPLTINDAKNIAQIIHRNAVHLRKINLPDAVFTDESIFKPIEEALLCNGALTQFTHRKQNNECEQRIEKIIARNHAMRRDRENIAIGAGVGAAVGLLLMIMSAGVPALATASLPVMFAILLPWSGLIISAACVLIGLLIALPFAWHARSAAISASHELQRAQSTFMQPEKKIEFIMTAQQFRRAMKKFTSTGEMESVLSSGQKAKAQLSKALNATATPAKEKSVMLVKTEDGQKIDDLQKIAKMENNAVLKACVTAPRFQLFATTKQVMSLTDDAPLKDDALDLVIDAYKDYNEIKHFSAAAR